VPQSLLDVEEPHHDIGNLNTGVVDVVLNVHFPARKPQQPHERIAKNGIPQVADMRCLVGVNA
jgi:hypothetical protein